MNLEPGAQVGPYRIESRLGAGGMGEVYRAWDPRLDRAVALKIIGTSATPDRVARFEREARLAAGISHPHVLTIFDVGVAEGVPYLVTELIEGRTLREMLRRGPIEPERAVDLAAQIATGLSAAHARGVVHRDLKPENLMVTDEGRLKILDFGLARLEAPISGDSGTTDLVTSAGALMGTLGYMAPEQLRGETADARADIFAMGIVLHEMIAGASPFKRETGPATVAAILHDFAPALPATVRAAPALGRLIARCLAKSPAARFQSAADLAFALDSIELAPSELAPVAASDMMSVAVLPFTDMSRDADHGWLCDGIADELITALTQVSGLRVASRIASFRLRAHDQGLSALGVQLGVATVLEGSVRTAGDRLRIAVQLVNTSDGYQRWSKRFEGTRSDIFAFQDEIAQSVAGALQGILTPRDREALRRPETSVQAYEFYLRGRQLLQHFDHVAMEGARQMFERAIGVDRNYALPYTGLADTYSWRYEWWGGDAADLDAAERASRRALELGPDLAEAHTSHGFLLALTGRYEESNSAFEHAKALVPNSFDAHYLQARMCFAWGKVAKSADLFKRAAEIRPEDFQSLVVGSQNLRMLGRPEEANEMTREGLRRAEHHLEFVPTDARALSLSANALCDLNRLDEAMALLNRALALHPGDMGVLVNGACVFARSGMTERAIDLLECAHATGWGKRDWVERDPDYDSLREHPRFKALLAQLH